MTAPTSARLPDVNSLCRTWRDSNGHIFTVESLDWDPERDGGIVLSGTCSNCQCFAHRWQHYGHDGPSSMYAVDLEDLTNGIVFGWEPIPLNHADLVRFVTVLVACTEQEWKMVTRFLDDPDAVDGEEMSEDLFGAVWALTKLDDPFLAFPDADLMTDPEPRLQVVRDMVANGHTDAGLIAAAVLAGLSVAEADALPAGLDEAERRELTDRLVLVSALREG